MAWEVHATSPNLRSSIVKGSSIEARCLEVAYYSVLWYRTARNLPDTPCSTALTLELTIYNSHRGTKLVALSIVGALTPHLGAIQDIVGKLVGQRRHVL